MHASKKEELLRSLSGERTPTAADRLLVSEMLTKVEATCPETQPAYSALMNGEWEVVYSGGVSPGPVPSPTREIALLMYAGGFTPGSFLLSVRALATPTCLRAPSSSFLFSVGSPLKRGLVPYSPQRFF